MILEEKVYFCVIKMDYQKGENNGKKSELHKGASVIYGATNSGIFGGETVNAKNIIISTNNKIVNKAP